MAKKLITVLLVLVMITSIIGLGALGLEKGDSGEQVKKLQKRLIVLGYLKTTKVTGRYDDAEEEAVKQFQISNGLEPTGVADDETLEAIYNKKAKKASKKKTKQSSDKNDGNADSKTLGISTEVLLTMFKNYMVPFGISTYPMMLTEKEKDDKSIIMLFTKYCTLSIDQDNGMVQSFKVVSSEDDGTNQRIDEITSSFVGAMMLTNLSITADEAIAYVTQLAESGGEIELNGINYRVITGKPFTTVIALEVKPAA